MHKILGHLPCKILCFVLLLFLVGCGTNETVLRIAICHPFDNFDPIIVDIVYSEYLSRTVFESLVDIEYNRPVAVLADHWFWHDDDLLKIKIRDNVRFSNNSVMTSEDVYRSIERALKHPNSSIQGYGAFIGDFFIDDDDICIYYNDIEMVFQFLSKVPIYSAAYLAFDDDFLKINPMSTGEYFLYSYSDHLKVFKKNIYHRDYIKNKNKPDVVEVYFETDYSLQYQMLKDDEIDFMFPLPWDLYTDAFNSKGIYAIEKDSNRILVLMLDSVSDVSKDIDLPLNPLKDIRVRQAIAHALDIEQFASEVLYDKVNILNIPSFRNVLGYPIEKEPYAFDLDRSMDLMSMSGYPNGFELKIRIYDNLFSRIVAEFVQESLKNINIRVVIDHKDAIRKENDIETNPASMLLLEMTLNNDMTLFEIMRTLFYFPKNDIYNSLNFMKYNNVYINDIIDRLSTLGPFDTQLMSLHSELVDIVYEQIYIIPFFQPKDLFVSNEKFHFQYRDNFKFTDFQVKK